MNFEELKKVCDEKIKNFPYYESRYNKEIIKAKITYDEGFDISKELEQNKERLSKRYVIPFLLGLTDEVRLDLPIELKQIKPGDGGGLDIDSDFSSAGKEKIKKYLEEKYSKERVISVGTYSSLGLASATKDILRKEPDYVYSEANEFCSNFDSECTFEENIESIKQNNKSAYEYYLKHKKMLDYVPKILNKIRSVGRHAGGVVLLPSPVWEHIPVERVQGELVTAFVENGSSTTLDEIGYVKIDLLAISVLDVMDSAIDMIDEKLFLIEDDDGITKIVPESYINKNDSKN